MSGLKDPAQASPGSLPPQVVMMQMITGKWVSQAIYAAAELGIADLLAEGDKSADELAQATGANADSLYRLLRALTTVGIFIEKENRVFRNTRLGETLQRGVPGSMRGFARLMGMDMSWKAWGEIVYSIKTSECAFSRAAGKSTFDYIGENPDAAEVVNEAMTSISTLVSRAVAQSYDFSSARTIVDVGGGHGLLLAMILTVYPHLRGILFELPHAVEGARRLFADHGLTPRVEVLTGDALLSVPPGGDIYIMKHIIHDWDDARATRFITNCAAALDPGGKLLLVESVLTPPDVPHFSKLLDLEMLIMSLGGRERTEEEYRHLYTAAGLSMTGIHSIEGPHSIIEGIKPQA
jgi:C-methyltransferase